MIHVHYAGHTAELVYTSAHITLKTAIRIGFSRIQKAHAGIKVPLRLRVRLNNRTMDPKNDGEQFLADNSVIILTAVEAKDDDRSTYFPID